MPRKQLKEKSLYALLPNTFTKNLDEGIENMLLIL